MKEKGENENDKVKDIFDAYTPLKTLVTPIP